jgi:hypothetical protein
MGHNYSRILWGAVFIVIGVLFLADNFGWLDMEISFHKLWPLFLIVVGLSMLLRSLPAKNPDKKD